MIVRDQPVGFSQSGATRLGIYRLVPTAARNDRRLARNALHGEVVVRAYSAEDARLVATEAELASRRAERRPGAADKSPFRDESLYAVVEVPGVAFLRPGKRGLIAGHIAGKPVAG